MPKRRLMGCSFPVVIVIGLIFLAFLIIGFLSGPLGKKMFGDVGLPTWLSVPRPETSLPAEVVFHIFGFPVTNSIIGSWITMAFLVIFSYVATHNMKVVPGRLQSAFESLVGYLYNFCERVAGEKHGRQFFPVVATIFLFVAFNAWLSLIPGFGSITIKTHEGVVPLLRGANTDINMPLALALMSFVFVEYFGLKVGGIRYLTKFINVGPFFKSVGQLFQGEGGIFNRGINVFVAGVNIGVGLLEGLSELVRNVSFTFRLFGNMTAGEILLLIAAFLIPWVFSDIFYTLELLVGFVQALIFSGLTLVFLTLATAHHGE